MRDASRLPFFALQAGFSMPDKKKNIKILLVEDNSYDAKIVQDLFAEVKDVAFSVRLADTLAKAQALDQAERSDIALLDLNLPDSFGPETLHRTQKFMQDRPVIVLTGFYEEQLGLSLIKKGAQDYLVKGKITSGLLTYAIRYAIERARIELRMKQRESRLRDILEKTPDGFLVSGAGGRVLFSNRGAELLLGRTKEALAGAPLDLKTDPGQTLETELRKPDGRKTPAEVRAVQIQWGEEDARLIMLRDLTPVRQLERNRDEFISRVSHELRSPLTVVKEALELIADGTMGEVTREQGDLLKMGLDNAARLNRLIDALLDITKIEAGVMPMDVAAVSLNGLLAATSAEYCHQARERGITLAADLPEQTLTAYCDSDKVRQVLVNLVSNALKFTPGGGSITLSLRSWEGQALMCVENTGPGIAPEDLPKLFTKFAKLGTTSSSAIKGTGLGLVISRGIAEMHQGRIWAESEPGKSCKFFLLLPLQPFEAALEHVVRREIAAAGAKRQFCALTLAIPQALMKEGLPSKAESFLRSHFRSAHAVLKRADGDFTLLISNSGREECAKAEDFLARGIKQLAGLQAEDPARLTFALLYPEDFQDEITLLGKLAAEHAKLRPAAAGGQQTAS